MVKLPMKILLLCLLLQAMPISLADVIVQDTETARLQAIFKASWDAEMQENPVWASSLGDRRFNQLWPDLSETARQARLGRYQRTLASLASQSS